MTPEQTKPEPAAPADPFPEGMYAIRNDGPRVQDGTSYFHGVYGGRAVKSSVFFGVPASGVVKSSAS